MYGVGLGQVRPSESAQASGHSLSSCVVCDTCPETSSWIPRLINKREERKKELLLLGWDLIRQVPFEEDLDSF